MASAKQLAARRKFARIMKSGGFKKKKGTTKGQVRKQQDEPLKVNEKRQLKDELRKQ